MRHITTTQRKLFPCRQLRAGAIAGAITVFPWIGIFGEPMDLGFSGGSQASAVFVEALKDGKLLGTGTAFEVVFTSDPIGEFHFFATAKHVIEAADKIRVYVNRNLNAPDAQAGKEKIKPFGIELYRKENRMWQESPEEIDIAVVFFQLVSASGRASRESDAQQYAAAKDVAPVERVWRANPPVAIPGGVVDRLDPDGLNDLFFSGYPLGMRSRTWLRPLSRRCTMAADSVAGMDFVDRNGAYFLIDYAPFEGDSGSPVFLHSIELEHGRITVKNRLAGVVSGKVQLDQMLRSNSQGLDTDVEVSLRRKVPIMGKVAPARYIEKSILAFIGRNWVIAKN